MNSLPEVSVYIPVESYCATNLLCPDLLFAENRVLKNRKLVKEIFYCALKNRKLVEEIFYCALKNRKRLGRFVLRVLKNRKNFIALNSCIMS